MGRLAWLQVAAWKAAAVSVDHYQLLGVDRCASIGQIKLAFEQKKAATLASRRAWSLARCARLDSAFYTLACEDMRRRYDAQLELFGGHLPQPPV